METSSKDTVIRFWNIPFIVLLLGALVTVFNVGVTNVAIPKITAALDANGLQIHFIANGLTLTLSAFVLLLGAVGDKYGRKLLFLLGCVLMLIVSICSALSTSPQELIVFRMIAGIAVAMLFPTTLSMITVIFQEKKQRLLAIGMWSGVAAGGSAIAPVVSGSLLEFFNWNSIYLISTPFTIIAFVLGIKFLPEFKNRAAPAIDYIGGFLIAIFVSLLLFAIILIPVDKLDAKVTISLIVSLASLLLFILREFKTKYPLLDLHAFKNARFSVGALTITLVAFAQLGVMFLAQQFVQNVLGYSTFHAGLSTFPLALAVVIASPISAKLSSKFGSRKIITIGLVLVGVGFLTALAWTVHSPYVQILISYLFIGIGLGLTMTPSTNAIMNSLPPDKAGVASAVNDVTRDFGNSLGVAVNGSIAAISYTTILQETYNKLPVAEQVPVAHNIAYTITGSLSGALEVAKRYPSLDATEMVTAAKHAFLDGQLAAMLLSAVLCFIGAIIVLIFMPKPTASTSPSPSQSKTNPTPPTSI